MMFCKMASGGLERKHEKMRRPWHWGWGQEKLAQISQPRLVVSVCAPVDQRRTRTIDQRTAEEASDPE